MCTGCSLSDPSHRYGNGQTILSSFIFPFLLVILASALIVHSVYKYIKDVAVHMFALFGGKVNNDVTIVNNGCCCRHAL